MEGSEGGTPNQVFAVRTSREGGCIRLALSGELDVASADELDDVIRQAEGRGGLRIVVDLGDLRFIDSTGLNVLLKARTRSRENGHRLTFESSRHDAVTRLLALTQTAELLGTD